MAEGLGRTVLHRHRYSRVWGLGNRSSPAVKTPAFISTEDDDDACKDLAAFHCLQTRTIPAEITVSTHHHLIPPDFQQAGPTMRASVGHVLLRLVATVDSSVLGWSCWEQWWQSCLLSGLHFR
ncbi:MAG: hypothetical protein ACPHHS_07875, partial [Candidatus Poseidoniaceae archaeon]